MTERAEKFLAAVSENAAWKEELKAKLEGAGLKEQYALTAAFAAEKGQTLLEEDFKPGSQEMDTAELVSIFGGSGCGCAVYGSGKGALDCRCYLMGVSDCGAGKGITSEGGCICTAAGAGASNKKK